MEVIITKTPSELKLSLHANWTLALHMHTEHLGISLLPALGLSYTLPTYHLEKVDPEKQRVFREETFPNLKKIFKEKSTIYSQRTNP